MAAGEAVFITGASRGLGAALAIRFAEAGHPVAICARGAAELERVELQVRQAGVACFTAVVDVTDEGAVERWLAEGVERLGSVGTLINNASVLGPRRPLARVDAGVWRETLEVNLTGTFLATRAALPHMLDRGSGSIINVSSGAAVPPRAGWGPYAVSKMAMEGFSLNLAEELQGTGVRVNLVDPGAMRTGMRADAYPEEDPDTLEEPMSRVGVFLWLAGAASASATGQRFRADRWRPD